MTSRKNAATLKYLQVKVEQMLLECGVGKKCRRHRKLAKLGVLWADGRAVAFFCDRKCFKAWKDSQGEWAEVVHVASINR